MSGKFAAAVILLLATPLVACGASHEIADAGGTDAPSMDVAAATDATLDAGPDLDAIRAWLHDYRTAACASLVHCPARYLFPQEMIFAREPDVCAAGEVPSTPVLVADVSDGTLAFDAENAAACLASARSGGCASVFNVRSGSNDESPCNHVFVAGAVTAALGDLCSGRYCAPGLACDSTPAPSTAGCAGAPHCAPMVPYGAPCDATSVCTNSMGGFGTCVGSVCADDPLAGAGEPCGSLVGPGMAYVFCMPRLYCTNVVNEAVTYVPRCGAPLHDGDVCPDGFQDWVLCPGGSTCVAASSGAPYVCTPITIQRTAGAPCNAYAREGDLYCDLVAGLICAGDGTCHVIDHVAVGEACGYSEWCTAPAHCDTTGHCVLPRPAGGPCFVPADCTSGVCGSDGLCADCPAP